MRTNAKQAYVTPEFIGSQVQLESGFCDASSVDEPITEDNSIRTQIQNQNGWEDTNKGFVDNSWQ